MATITLPAVQSTASSFGSRGEDYIDTELTFRFDGNEELSFYVAETSQPSPRSSVAQYFTSPINFLADSGELVEPASRSETINGEEVWIGLRYILFLEAGGADYGVAYLSSGLVVFSLSPGAPMSRDTPTFNTFLSGLENGSTAPFSSGVPGTGDAPTVIPFSDFGGAVIEIDEILAGTDEQDTINGGRGSDQIDGLQGDDLLFGDAGDDDISGGGGADVILGLQGDDNLAGGRGRDDLSGGTGDDRILGNNGADSLAGGNGADILLGGRGNDTIDGEDGLDIMSGGRGDDTLRGGKGEDDLEGGAGKDALNGGLGDDVLDGGTGKDSLSGGKNDDYLDAGAQADFLFGDEGADTLIGGRGADVLQPGPGNDTLTGGRGGDEFYFVGGADTNRITDFRPGQDDRIVIFSDNGNITQDISDITDFFNAYVFGGGASAKALISLDDGTEIFVNGAFSSPLDLTGHIAVLIGNDLIE